MTRQQQFLLAQEVVQTRGAELLRAYTDLVGIGFGFKTKGKTSIPGAREPSDDAPCSERLIRTPCVVFEVRKKLKLRLARHADRRLPGFVYLHLGEVGQRRLCAVPTDVKESASFGRPKPHHDDLTTLPFGIAVSQDGASDASGGTMTCVVQRPSDPGRLYALSCRHVLSRSLDETPDIPSGCTVRCFTRDGPKVGRSDKARGTFLQAPLPSFDAQLVAVDDRGALRRLFVGLRFDPDDPVLAGPEEIPNGFWVATPRMDEAGERRLVWIEFIDWPRDRPMPYRIDGETLAVSHTLVIHGRAVDDVLKPGDSGSPAILVRGGRKLIGMYLGGDGTNAYFIPAWQLFMPGNYGIKKEASWVLATGLG
jgi:hypothetical protein